MKNNQLDTKKVWKDEIRKNVMLYPDERVVAFIANNYKNEDNTNKNAIDIGFGSGRNLIPLLDNGFNCYGIDYNEECCKVAKNILSDRQNLKGLYHKEIEKNNFKENFFDVVVMYGVLFLNEYTQMKDCLEKIYKIMKKGGKMLVNFRTDEDFLNGKGEMINTNTYKIDSRAKVYEGSTYTFLNIIEVKKLLEESKFKIVRYEKNELWKNNLEERHSWWIFTVEKE